MKHKNRAAGVVLSAVLIGAVPAYAADLTVMVEGLKEGGMISERHAYCVPKGVVPSVPEGENKSPAIQWAKGPKGTQSYAIIMADTQVPTDFSTANKEGVAISDRMPRQIFSTGCWWIFRLTYTSFRWGISAATAR